MAKIIQTIRGMNDYLPSNTLLWQRVESTAKSILASYGYKEIRTPILESTSLFARAIGEVTDVVEKEMFSFDDRDNQSISLRPEGTAGCVRAGIQHSLFYNQEQRLWYMGPMFRYERPQKGRYRQFSQLGVETFGMATPDIDAELILLSAGLWRQLGIRDHVNLQINSIGSLEARNCYRGALVDFLQHHIDRLDEDSKRRLTTNPLRILDSKNQEVQSVLDRGPKLHDYLDEDSKQDFKALCALLDGLGIAYQINQKLVRGLDYYNKTVFEWVTDQLGAQGTICAGGRYDVLVEQLGGTSTSAIGFAIGLERLILLIEQTTSMASQLTEDIDVYLIHFGDNTQLQAFKLAELLRKQLPQLKIISHCGGGNIKKQFKKADKNGAKLAIIIGENEMNNQQVEIKHLSTHGQQDTVLFSDVVEYVSNAFN